MFLAIAFCSKLSAYDYLGYVSGNVTEVNYLANEKLYVCGNNQVKLSYPMAAKGVIDPAQLFLDGILVGSVKITDEFINKVFWRYTIINISEYFTDDNIHSIRLGWSINQPVHLIKESESSKIACSKQSRILAIQSYNTLKWEKSNDNGISWSDIICNTGIYTETNPLAGTYLYRALNGDGTYSAIKQVTYVDAVPSDPS